MRFKPVNPNTRWPNAHTLYLAASGGGKSQALNQNKAIPKHGARVLLWDPSGDHPGLHYEAKADFLKALKQGLTRGSGFRIAYGGPALIDDYEWFNEVVWSILDGEVATYVVVEELSAVCPHAGKATPNAAILLNQGRKYGLHWHGTSQKPQEISKTYFDQCEHKWIGRQKGYAMTARMAREIGVTPEQISALDNLQFYHDNGTPEPPQLVKLKYKAITGVKWG